MNEEQILVDIRVRMAELEPAVLESERLEAGLKALGGPVEPKRKRHASAVEALGDARAPG